MTDNEIVKALECCTSKMQCFDCPRFDGNWGMRAFTHCDTKLKSDALDLINRQKAEIERLKDGCANCAVVQRKSEIIWELNEQIEYWQRGYNNLRNIQRRANRVGDF